MFQKVLASFGSGGARVDGRLLDRAVLPGSPLRGEVHLLGGEVEQAVNSLSVSLLARVVVPGSRDKAKTEDLVFGNQQLVGREMVRPGQQVRLPFELRLPWETPISSFGGKPLSGIAVGIQTVLDVANAVADPMDIDAAAVEPLPAQKRVLDAVAKIGFTYRDATLEKGIVSGPQQNLPFFQEIRFNPSPRFAGVFNHLAVTFLAEANRTEVVLEVNKRVRVSKSGGFGGRGQDFCGAFTVRNDDLAKPWEQQIEGWLHEVAKPRGIFD